LITVSEALRLTLQERQLMPQQRVLSDQIGLAPGQIDNTRNQNRR
jgi:hypothetical protein